jgi:hypothetical protein
MTQENKVVKANQETIKLIFDITDNSGLKSVDVNGIIKEISGKKFTYSDSVKLQKGNNTVKITVKDIADNIATEAISVVFETKKMNMAVTKFKAEGVSESEAVAVENFLETELVSIGGFKVITRSDTDMNAITEEQRTQLSDVCNSEECAVKMGHILGAEKIIIGTFGKLMDTYYIHIKVLDVESGEVIHTDKQKVKTFDDIETATKLIATKISDKFKSK